MPRVCPSWQAAAPGALTPWHAGARAEWKDWCWSFGWKDWCWWLEAGQVGLEVVRARGQPSTGHSHAQHKATRLSSGLTGALQGPGPGGLHGVDPKRLQAMGDRGRLNVLGRGGNVPGKGGWAQEMSPQSVRTEVSAP